MTGLVVDASVALKWLIDEPGSDAALALQGREMAAPTLLRLEVANTLRTLVARSSMDRAQAADLFALFRSAPVTIVEGDDRLEADALRLALTLDHPVYDCVYLALAERLDRSLVTADRRFATAAARHPFGARIDLLSAEA